MAMPPAVLAKNLLLANPEFVMAGSAEARVTLLDMAMDTQSYSGLIQYLQENPEESAAMAAALKPDGAPSAVAVPLPAGIVDALWAVWAEMETSAFKDDSLRDLCWWVVQGLAPGLEAGGKPGGSWELKPVGPVGMVEFPSVGYTNQLFAVSLRNGAPRHLCGYVRFEKNGMAVEPDGWVSRLPTGVPAAFESKTVKYLGRFAPQVAVSGFAMKDTPQTASFAMPANADSAQLAFGGLGSRRFDGLMCAGGLGLTYWLDFMASWTASRFPDALGTDAWFTGMLADSRICDAAMASDESLLQAADTPAALDRLADQATAIFLGSGMKALRDSIDKQFGLGSAADLAATAGWSAQIVVAGLRKQPQTQSWVSAVDAAAVLPLAASSSLEVQVKVLPDPAFGTFPFDLAGYAIELACAGLSQLQKGPVTIEQASAGEMTVAFGSVRNLGPIEVSVKLTNAAGLSMAEGWARLEQPALARDRLVKVPVATVESRIPLGPGTKFAKVRSLAFRNGAYIWDTGKTASGNGSGLALFAITVSGRAQSVGYVWNTSKRTVPNCSAKGSVPAPYLMQSVGTIVPGDRLKTISCGFVMQPGLAYETEAGMFLDPRTSPSALRDVDLAAGPFNLTGTVSRGRFSSQSLDSVALGHGYAAGVSSTDDRLEIVPLADLPVADAFAPLPVVVGGTGARVGLLSQPVAVAITGSGAVLVLERGNQRVQAFDLEGNSLAAFNGKAVVAVSGTDLRDLSVGPVGDLYVLGGNGVEVLSAGGASICSIKGLEAARIAVDYRGLIYALEEGGIVGESGSLEPGISVWAAV